MDKYPGFATTCSRQYQHVFAFGGDGIALGVIEGGENIRYIHRGIIARRAGSYNGPPENDGHCEA